MNGEEIITEEFKIKDLPKKMESINSYGSMGCQQNMVKKQKAGFVSMC